MKHIQLPLNWVYLSALSVHISVLPSLFCKAQRLALFFQRLALFLSAFFGSASLYIPLKALYEYVYLSDANYAETSHKQHIQTT